MNVFGEYYRTIYEVDGSNSLILNIIDQNRLPFNFELIEIDNCLQMIDAIKDMKLRGAPLIGIAGAYAVCLLFGEMIRRQIIDENAINQKIEMIKNARPTAVNLALAVDEVYQICDFALPIEENYRNILNKTRQLYNTEIERSRLIGEHGKQLIIDAFEKNNHRTINILTHCNAGWLATVDYGTALAPIYAARDAGVDLHVWVDETRPRNQGAKLTAFELLHENIKHTIIADNTGGHLMQHNMVDMVIVGTDRTTRNGDVCNKIGTYLKALAAKDNNVPFYVALPSSSLDTNIFDGINEIPIEVRDPSEILFTDTYYNGRLIQARNAPIGSKAVNYGFDVTPARLIDALITEYGIFAANRKSIDNLTDKMANEKIV